LAAVPSIGRASFVERPHVAPHAEATSGLYERHAAKIQAYCHHQLGSREEAEDAVQTTFMNAFRALGRGVVPEAESAWLFKIAENVCLSRRRSSWRRGRIESPSDFEVIEEVVPGPSRQRDELIGIEDALAAMPEQQRRAILLREWQGLSYREVAEELEISQSAVETLIFRARRSLAQGLEEPETISKPKRKGLRRALRALDLGSILAAAKTLLAGSAAVKATAAAVAVTAAAGTAATVKHEGHSPQWTPKAAVVAKTPAPAPAPAQAGVPFAPADLPTAAPVPAKLAAPVDATPKATVHQDAPAAVAPVASAPASHEPAPAPVAAEPQPEHHPEPAPGAPAVEVKSDEGQSGHTPVAIAPVLQPVTPVPAPSEPTSGGRGTSGQTSPVTVVSIPGPTPVAPVTVQTAPTSTVTTTPVVQSAPSTTTVQPVSTSTTSPTAVTTSFGVSIGVPTA
jgi:RNA polymerase sigma factor (sigma-70 family)